MNEPFDFKRFALLNIKRIWIVLLAVVIGALLFLGLYSLYRSGKEPIYRSDILYEIQFDRNQVDNIHDYYNDYTWNDILDSDAIAGVAADLLGVDKADIAASTTIPTMSDIRFIHVYVDTDSANRSRLYADAMAIALSSYAMTTDGFASISIVDDEQVFMVEAGSYFVRCTLSGAVVGLIIGLLVLCYTNAMDDRIYFAGDIRRQLGRVCIYPFFEAKANSLEDIEGKSPVIETCQCGEDEAKLTQDIIKAAKLATNKANDNQDVVMVVRAGVSSVLALKRDYDNILAKGSNVLAIIIYYKDARLYRAYYGQEKSL